MVAVARPGVGGAGAGFDASEHFVNLRVRVRRGQDGGDRALNPSGWPNRVGDGFEVARETVVHLPDALHGGVRRFQGFLGKSSLGSKTLIYACGPGVGGPTSANLFFVIHHHHLRVSEHNFVFKLCSSFLATSFILECHANPCSI